MAGHVSPREQELLIPFRYKHRADTILCKAEMRRILIPRGVVDGERWVKPGRGTGSGASEEGGEEGFKEDVPIFVVIDGHCGHCGNDIAVFAAEGVLDIHWSAVSAYGNVARQHRAVMLTVDDSQMEGEGQPGDARVVLLEQGDAEDDAPECRGR
jgi:hypothetical protein